MARGKVRHRNNKCRIESPWIDQVGRVRHDESKVSENLLVDENHRVHQAYVPTPQKGGKRIHTTVNSKPFRGVTDGRETVGPHRSVRHEPDPSLREDNSSKIAQVAQQFL